MLRWVFRRHANAITCEVDSTVDHFEVSVIPHWDVAASAIERFESASRAMQRHAELAMTLRESGWVVVDHGCAARRRVAA